jgi:hypothetical protein
LPSHSRPYVVAPLFDQIDQVNAIVENTPAQTQTLDQAAVCEATEIQIYSLSDVYF